eukprot:TRINITY_DN13490_c0_g1_i1.p2 TRINITY_DN13490_c0_g1~~TRINITY_DN13490_c0_g1_i1.p2  ORF type:complete len:52 (+),score=1.33 TRINITY_DN13490_c0_g1_i1:161-316(+)
MNCRKFILFVPQQKTRLPHPVSPTTKHFIKFWSLPPSIPTPSPSAEKRLNG